MLVQVLQSEVNALIPFLDNKPLFFSFDNLCKLNWYSTYSNITQYGHRVSEQLWDYICFGQKHINFLLLFCTYFLNLPICHKYTQSSQMTTYGIAKRIRHKHLPYLHQPPCWGRAGLQIGFSHFRHHNVSPSHCSIHYVLPWEWGEVHAENQGRKWPPARRGKMASVIIPAPPQGELARI